MVVYHKTPEFALFVEGPSILLSYCSTFLGLSLGRKADIIDTEVLRQQSLTQSSRETIY